MLCPSLLIRLKLPIALATAIILDRGLAVAEWTGAEKHLVGFIGEGHFLVACLHDEKPHVANPGFDEQIVFVEGEQPLSFLMNAKTVRTILVFAVYGAVAAIIRVNVNDNFVPFVFPRAVDGVLQPTAVVTAFWPFAFPVALAPATGHCERIGVTTGTPPVLHLIPTICTNGFNRHHKPLKNVKLTPPPPAAQAGR